MSSDRGLDQPDPAQQRLSPVDFDPLALLGEGSRANPGHATQVAEGRRHQSREIGKRNGKDAHSAPVDQQIKGEHAKLSQWADINLNGHDKDFFKELLDDFDKRISRGELSSQEVLNTLKQIQRVADATGETPLSSSARKDLVQQLMFRGAYPGFALQGTHGTCNVGAVEDVSEGLAPSESARLVADIALTGKYTAPDGTTVQIDPSQIVHSLDHERELSDAIYQTAALNVFYARQNSRTGADVHYEERKPEKPGDTGERLVDYSKHPPEVKLFPGLNAAQIAETRNALLGKQDQDVVLVHSSAPDAKEAPGLGIIHSEAELAQKLSELKAQHKLPVVVGIQTETEPFYTDSGRTSAPGVGLHVVTIGDYDEKRGTVSVFNSEASFADHYDLNLHDMYIGMENRANAEKSIAERINDINKNHYPEHGKIEPAYESEKLVKQVELLRLQRQEQEINADDAEKTLQEYMAEASLQKKTGRLTEDQQDQEFQEIETMIYSLPLEARPRILNHAHQLGLISDKECLAQLTILDRRSDYTYKHLSFFDQMRNSIEWESYKREWQKSYRELPPMTLTEDEIADVMAKRNL